MSYRISGDDFDTAGLATRQLKEQLARIGVGSAAMRRAMIASYEAEMNVVIHARTGTLWARLDSGRLDLEIADEGPGIPNVELALREGWSTASEKARQMGFGAGMGLPNIRRNSDLFDIETRVGRGTRIRSTILLDAPAGPVEAAGPAAASMGVVGTAAERCRACLRCIFACPTAALRVRPAGPDIRSELCIGCTACFDECRSGVYRIHEPCSGSFSRPPGGAVLVVPRGFLFDTSLGGAEQVLAALSSLGFAEVRLLEEWTAALRAEARTAACTAACAGNAPLPLIPPVCPAVVHLVESRFPSLIPNLCPWLSPIEAAGEEFPLRPVFLAAACAAQYAVLRHASLTDRLTALTPIRLAEAVRGSCAAQPRAGGLLLRAPRGEPGRAPGEIAVSGVRHVMRVLAMAESGALPGVSLLDLSLCATGCSGSPLLHAGPGLGQDAPQAGRGTPSDAAAVPRGRPYTQRSGVRLDPDMTTAIRALGKIDALARALPGRDCGACGAPSCALFAEDVVLGRAEPSDCPHAARPFGPPRGGGYPDHSMEETR